MDEKIGARIKQVRESQGLNQRDFGQRLSVSLPTITRVEKGYRVPDGEFIVRMVEAFDCDVRWLLLGEGDIAGECGRIPILTKISDDWPHIPEQNIAGYLSLPDVASDTVAIKAVGEEMLPSIRPGDFVLFKPGEAGQGDVVVLTDRWRRLCLRRLAVDGRNAVLVAENPDYPVIRGEDAEILGSVIEVVRRLLV